MIALFALSACSTPSTNVLQTVCDLPTTCEGFQKATAEFKAQELSKCIEKSVEGHPAEQALFTTLAELPPAEKTAALDKAAAAQGVTSCALSGIFVPAPIPGH